MNKKWVLCDNHVVCFNSITHFYTRVYTKNHWQVAVCWNHGNVPMEDNVVENLKDEFEADKLIEKIIGTNILPIM